MEEEPHKCKSSTGWLNRTLQFRTANFRYAQCIGTIGHERARSPPLREMARQRGTEGASLETSHPQKKHFLSLEFDKVLAGGAISVLLKKRTEKLEMYFHALNLCL